MGAFALRGTYIGTIRLIPMDRGLAPCEALIERQAFLSARQHEAAWEVGRLVLAPQYRSSPEALKRCLFLTLLYLVRTRDIRNLYASCSPVLSRLYRRFAFGVVVRNACEQSDGTYSLIHGYVSEVLMALACTDGERETAKAALQARNIA